MCNTAATSKTVITSCRLRCQNMDPFSQNGTIEVTIPHNRGLWNPNFSSNSNPTTLPCSRTDSSALNSTIWGLSSGRRRWEAFHSSLSESSSYVDIEGRTWGRRESSSKESTGWCNCHRTHRTYRWWVQRAGHPVIELSEIGTKYLGSELFAAAIVSKNKLLATNLEFLMRGQCLGQI